MGVAVWPMVELEADDALAAAARIAGEDDGVEQVRIWTPDKDLAQCVRGDRVVQIDRRAQAVRNDDGVREKFGVEPALIPDFLALVGDSADGYPGIPGIGARHRRAAREPARRRSRTSRPRCSGSNRELALLFKDLATLQSGRRALPGRRRAAVARADERLGRMRRASRRRPAARAVPGGPRSVTVRPDLVSARSSRARANADTSVRIASPANSSDASARSPAAASPAPHASVMTMGM